MKYEWRKAEKAWYGAKQKPQILTVPLQKFIAIDGVGDPNQADFAERVAALYALTYGLKMTFKKSFQVNSENQSAEQLTDFTVFPLEGLWDSSNETDFLDKDSFIYTIMIQQPAAITEVFYKEVLAAVSQKKKLPLLTDVKFIEIAEEEAVQMLHLGAFEKEAETFAVMADYLKEAGYQRKGHVHREIYLNDARKTPPEKRKTILRYPVEKM
ncbi:GyrI-like domain-containing protein [Enterococcus sp. HY326]|uniref:GyrI-like domain-containing protein n=1 Tax=Enterococcus sp. HY326 TaxID=2971265 RepID=UPI0022403859|nr:GyrI-like domain-containing protein [Enterococcus sp. HY326]